ncbi:MAG: 30S ribosomal protein S4e [Candidatus Norongarragalinales archaeon]
MAGHGCSRHLKALAAPRALRVPRKQSKFAKKVSAGPAAFKEAIPLLVVLRDALRLAGDAREAKKVLNEASVLVDGRVVRDSSFPVGLMSVVAIPAINAFYRVVMRKNKLELVRVAPEVATVKYCRVKDKKTAKKGRMQVVFHDGRSLLIEKEEDRFKTGDTIKLGVPEQEIKGFLKLEKNALCFVSHGKHSGALGRLVSVEGKNARLAVEAPNASSAELVTLKDYVFVVDEDFAKPFTEKENL